MCPLIFEFGTFNKKTFATPNNFLAVLDPFLKALPGGFRPPSTRPPRSRGRPTVDRLSRAILRAGADLDSCRF